MRLQAGLAALAFLALGLTGCPSIDGSDNNPFDPELGTPGSALLRVAGADYGDGVSSLAGAGRPSPRTISNLVHDQPMPRIPNAAGKSDYIWQWGQFLDHDIDLTPGDSGEAADIPVPAPDLFDPPGVIFFTRSGFVPGTGTDPSNPREHPNLITAWIDASNVYGSDDERAEALRLMDGSGQLRTSAGGLLPFNTLGLENDNGPMGGDDEDFFVAGDIRANEQAGLTAMHTLFVREHNFWAQFFEFRFPHLSGDNLYELARAMVIAIVQRITFEEYLPHLLGPGAIPPYAGYDPSIDAQIATEFSTALFRVGHTQLSATLLRLDPNGDPIPEGHLALRNAFFDPANITGIGIDPYLRGLAGQVANAVDPFVIDDVRNFLFGPPGAGGFDLASLNIQRGRDHGIPSYNEVRSAYGLAPAAGYDDISSDPAIQARLEAAYGAGNVDDVDVWSGALCEDTVPGALVGELILTGLVEQFTALRDGDRFWYERHIPGFARSLVDDSTLATVIRRNTAIGGELPDDVFVVP